jgi:hypothetical protein
MSKQALRPQSVAEQASRELRKLVRMIRLLRRRGDRAVCHRLLSHARVVQEFVENRQYSQALHAARCRMMG